MIRIRKPVKLLEWGEGTNTTNQIWTVCGEGRITATRKSGSITTLVVSMNDGFQKKNNKDSSIKVAQQGEGMTAASRHWGEVAMGILKTVRENGKLVEIEIGNATKLDSRANVPAWEEG